MTIRKLKIMNDACSSPSREKLYTNPLLHPLLHRLLGVVDKVRSEGLHGGEDLDNHVRSDVAPADGGRET